jgi:membrane fusion protein, multidrug efflux system
MQDEMAAGALVWNRFDVVEVTVRSLLGRKVVIGGILLVAVVAITVVAGCSKGDAAGGGAAPEVDVVQVEQKDVPIYVEHIGTLDGFVNADVRAQVTGYLMRQEYQEGAFVKAGQLLFEIDPRPFQATLDQAKAQLAQAQAQLANAEALQLQAQLNVNKYIPLVEEQAASQQDRDNAVQTNVAAKATVLNCKAAIQAAEAAVKTAQINLDFTRLIAPIDGIAGQAQLQVGALVTPASGVVTTVSTVNPIKVFFTVSEAEWLEWRQRFPTETRTQEAAKALHLQLILADGSTYPREGTFDFADRQVDVGTGAIRIAALFSNPDAILRPGGYGRVRAVIRTEHDALVVPQRSVSELQGSYQVAVVDKENKVSIRPVKVGDTSGSEWVIAEGLKPGERVVAEGVQKVRPGMVVSPKPFVAQAKGD